MANPTRAGRRPFLVARTVKHESTDFSGSEKTRLKSAALVKRAQRGSRASTISPGSASWSGREPRTSLRAPRLDHLAAVTGGHAGAKTVGSDTLQAAWLKGSFHF
jgi:hypothetical protein